MLFWIFVILLIIYVVCVHIEDTNPHYDLETVCILSLLVGVIGLLISIAFLIMGHINVNGNIRKNWNTYESLVYQLENDIYDNDNDLGKKQLYEDIQKWNSDLAWYQEAQDDFWVGIFIPDIFDQFEFIELE